MSLDLNDRKSVIEFARQFDKQRSGIVCLAENELVIFARALAEQLGVYREQSTRAVETPQRKLP